MPSTSTPDDSHLTVIFGYFSFLFRFPVKAALAREAAGYETVTVGEGNARRKRKERLFFLGTELFSIVDGLGSPCRFDS